MYRGMVVREAWMEQVAAALCSVPLLVCSSGGSPATRPRRLHQPPPGPRPPERAAAHERESERTDAFWLGLCSVEKTWRCGSFGPLGFSPHAHALATHLSPRPLRTLGQRLALKGGVHVGPHAPRGRRSGPPAARTAGHACVSLLAAHPRQPLGPLLTCMHAPPTRLRTQLPAKLKPHATTRVLAIQVHTTTHSRYGTVQAAQKNEAWTAEKRQAP